MVSARRLEWTQSRNHEGLTTNTKRTKPSRCSLLSDAAAGAADRRRTPKNLQAAQGLLTEHGWSIESGFEIPQGPCLVFRDPGGQRLAAYHLVRPFMNTRFEGRFDT